MSNFNFEKWEARAKDISNLVDPWDEFKKNCLTDDFVKTLSYPDTTEEDNLWLFAKSEEKITPEECIRALKLIKVSENSGLFVVQQLLIKRFLKSIGYEEIANLIDEYAFPRKS